MNVNRLSRLYFPLKNRFHTLYGLESQWKRRFYSDIADNEIIIPARIHRENESLETKKARLVYQSRKRGILESDLLCSTFAQKYLDSLTSGELDLYDNLLDENDWNLFYWCSGQRDIPERLQDNSILKMMQKHFQNEGRTLLKMPSLRQ